MRLLAEDRQLALADLVQDLPRLLVAELVDLAALQLPEQVERHARDPDLRVCGDVIRVSRPKSVMNHGSPAAGST